ncbi:MAG TPA: EVE domain-containing protein [Dehalococcoidia bacterium]|nr:EVE domain-containing protein [Dehalococcoidia bacterium]|tara:strand:+ start:1259 stop:1729 length:471 start_codon:yes stop_codon:yes gene_type:complete
MSETKYWLFKSEPNNYSFLNLLSEENQIAEWDGVRNYQARNFMRDQMRIGDKVLFYHSSTKIPAVIGTAIIVKESYPDFTAWDSGQKYFDPKSNPDDPTWLMVDIQAEKTFKTPVTLQDIKSNPKFANMMLVKRGVRLSVQPITQTEYNEIVKLGE